MKTKDKLHDNLDNKDKVNKILFEFGLKWWLFGVGCGVVFYWLVNLLK